MHDKDFIRKNPDAFKAAMQKRNLDIDVTKLLELDAADRGGKTEVQTLQAKANEIAKQIPIYKKEGKDIAPLLAEGKALKEKIAAMEGGEGGAFDEALKIIPNILDENVPAGMDESNNKEIRVVGTKPSIAGPKDHVALGEGLGMMNFEDAARMSGARFVVLTGQLARLERALASFMLDLHTGTNGYTETNPPYLVQSEALYGTGQLPKFEDDLFSTSLPKNAFRENIKELIGNFKPFTKRYNDETGEIGRLVGHYDLSSKESREKSEQSLVEDLYAAFLEDEANFYQSHGKMWLIPTAEVSLTNLVMNTIIDPRALPMRYTAHTPCFRSEAGAAGKDTKGMIRQHQFSKVELVSITKPEDSNAEHERMLSCAEEVLKRLGLHYRVMLLCAGDTGFSARKTYDIEVWLPGQNTFREISSCSNCGDFQARRMKARYRKGDKPEFVHTLNGSGLAVGRTLIAVLENYQQPDGSIAIPETLQPYMGGMKTITK